MSYEYEPSGSEFIDNYVDYAMTELGDGLPYAYQLGALGILSALAGPRIRIPVTSAEGINLCLWTCFVVNSTEGRKTKTLNAARPILRETILEEGILVGDGSTNGIIEDLQTRDGQTTVWLRDELSSFLQAATQKNSYMSALPTLFVQAYDSQPLSLTRTRKGPEGGKLRVTMPYFVITAASTWDQFVKYVSADSLNASSGFLVRFILYSGTVDPQPMRVYTAQGRMRLNTLITMARRIQQNARALEVGGLMVTQDVLDREFAAEQAWRAETDNPQVRLYFKRLVVSALKIAGLLSIENTRDEITLEAFERALRMITRYKAAGAENIRRVGGSEFQSNARWVMDIIRRYPEGITRTGLYRACDSRFKAADLDAIINTLALGGMVRSSPNLRGTIVYFPITYGDQA